MQKFLDATCENLNNRWDTDKAAFAEDNTQLSKAIDAVNQIFGKEHAFKKYKDGTYETKYNRSVIDILLFYFANPIIRKSALTNALQVKMLLNSSVQITHSSLNPSSKPQRAFKLSRPGLLNGGGCFKEISMSK